MSQKWSHRKSRIEGTRKPGKDDGKGANCGTKAECILELI